MSRTVLLWVMMMVLVLGIIEGLAALTLPLLTANSPGVSLGDARRAVAREIHARSDVDGAELAREIDILYEDRVEANPYRWYEMPRDFRGRYFQTDEVGFRIDRSTLRETSEKIGFFGGSTAFSVTTNAKNSIPAILDEALDPCQAQTLNFGMGGYSTSAELMLFIEVARRENLAVAVFYDGVNEINRYAESLQNRADSTYLDVLGYPFMNAHRAAAENMVVGDALVVRYEPFIVRLTRAALYKTSGRVDPTRRISIDRAVTADNVGAHAERIVQIYLDNLADITAIANARGITPVFFWQTEIYSTKKTLTAYELDVRAEHPGMRLLSDAVRARLRKEPALERYTFFDLSHALDGLGNEPHFFDYCHLSPRANRLIAEKMVEALQGVLPTEYWRDRSPVKTP